MQIELENCRPFRKEGMSEPLQIQRTMNLTEVDESVRPEFRLAQGGAVTALRGLPTSMPVELS
jgi:hypothetical protein